MLGFLNNDDEEDCFYLQQKVQITVSMHFPYKNVSKYRIDVNFVLPHTTSLHLTSCNEQCLLPGMITPLHSKYMPSSYHHARQITSWGERAYCICRLWVITANSVPNM